MALPQIAAPEFEATIPSTGQNIFFRPFLVKEEKALYMAMEGGEQGEIINAVVNVLSACIKDDIDVNTLSYFDIEYLFLKLRAKSVGDVVTLRFRHGGEEPECRHVQEINIDLDKVELERYDDHTDKVMITEDVGVKLKYPNLDSARQLGGLNTNNLDDVFTFLTDSVEYIFDKETVYEDNTKSDIKDWLENLNQNQFEKIMSFFNTMPKLVKELSYTCDACGKEESIKIEGLQGFFG